MFNLSQNYRKAKVKIVFILVLVVGVGILSGADSILPSDLKMAVETPVSRETIKACNLSCDMFYFLEAKAHLGCTFADMKTFERWRKIEIRGVYKDLEVKYLLSWWLYYGNSGAHVEASTNLSNQASERSTNAWTIVIDDVRTPNTYTQFYNERIGSWCENLSKRLQEPYQPPRVEILFFDLIKDLAVKKGLSIIFDQKAMYVDDTMSVHVFESSKTSDTVLASALQQLGLAYSLQGGVVYITSKEREYSAPRTSSKNKIQDGSVFEPPK